MFEKPKTGIVVDGETRGNPGPSQYRGMDLATGIILFENKIGYSTNNITEFLALVHAFGYARKSERKCQIYSDSMTALTWFKNKHSKSTLKPGRYTQKAIDLKDRAVIFLKQFQFDLSEDQVIKYEGIEVLKWFTSEWGEIPADYGNKQK